MAFPAKLFGRTKGFLQEDEARRLYEIALEAGGLGPCLEIGGYCGKSTLCLGAACRQRRTVLFSIDHHRGSEEQQPGEEYFDPELLDPADNRIDTFRFFRKTLEAAGLEDTVVPMVCRSEVAARRWSTPLALVFIDGGHSFTDAFTDYSVWAPHLIPDGYLLIHDIFTDPAQGGQAPYRVWSIALASGLFVERPMTGTLGILQRSHAGQP